MRYIPSSQGKLCLCTSLAAEFCLFSVDNNQIVGHFKGQMGSISTVKVDGNMVVRFFSTTEKIILAQ